MHWRHYAKIHVASWSVTYKHLQLQLEVITAEAQKHLAQKLGKN